MAFKEKYSAEEWKTLKYAVMWVFNAVAAADNKIDKKEKKALESVLNNSGKFFNDVAREIFMDINKDFETFNKEFLNEKRDIQTGLQEVSDLLGKHLDDEIALNFKKTLIAIGVFIGHSSGSLFRSNLSDVEVEQIKKIGDMLHVTVGDLEKPPNLQQIIQNLNLS